jgi:transcriptional regulator with PAS, ATPase and Fis domain
VLPTDNSGINRKALANGSDVIISRGGTAAMIERELKIPVVYIVFSSVDLIKTIEKAKVYGNNIGVIGYENLIGELKGNYHIFGCRLCAEKVNDHQEINEKIKYLYNKENVSVFIGGDAVIKGAEELGLTGVLMECGRESIRRAVLEATHLAQMKINEAERYLQFKAISEHSNNGIIYVDEDLRVRYMNPVAQMICAKKIENVIGLSICEVFPNSKLDTAIMSRKPLLSIYEQVNDTKILTNYIPLTLHKRIIGGIISFQDVTKIEELEKKVRREQYTKGLIAKYKFTDILTNDQTMIKILNIAKRIARVDSNVLITGESGTGKELIAQSIHNESPRKNGPFVAINCAALPENLLESELFGYVDGAFTGARKGGKPGLFELAHMGTIFLDEIGDMPLNLQSHLLRVIQEKEVNRIGDDKVIPVNIRIIAATNKDLKELTKQGKFREDLHYRLDIVKIKLPSLRERIQDIPFLSKYFIGYYGKLNRLNNLSISTEALDLLKIYSWPGNVRELQNFIESLVIASENEIITREMVEQLLKDKLDNISFLNIKKELEKQNKCSISEEQNNEGLLKKIEYQNIKEVLDRVQGDKVKAAQILGISYTTLWRKLKKLQRKLQN